MSIPPWAPTVLAYVADEYDRANALNGASRYGAYLAQHLADFHEYDEPDTPLPATAFAAAAWRIATSPVMSPGYVRVRPDIARVAAVFDDGACLRLTITVPLPHRDLAARLAGWGDWEHDPYGHGDGPYRRLIAPYGGPLAILATASISLPVDETALPVPRHVRGPGLLDDARQAVRALAEQLNLRAAPAVARLHGQQAGSVRQ